MGRYVLLVRARWGCSTAGAATRWRWENKIADEDGYGARTTHYVYEPGSFMPVVQACSRTQPEYGDYYRQDEDPLWLQPPAPPIDGLAWYLCDYLGTPQEMFLNRLT